MEVEQVGGAHTRIVAKKTPRRRSPARPNGGAGVPTSPADLMPAGPTVLESLSSWEQKVPPPLARVIARTADGATRPWVLDGGDVGASPNAARTRTAAHCGVVRGKAGVHRGHQRNKENKE